MTQLVQSLNFNRYYHIYNRGINSCDIFMEDSNYEHFLKLFTKYIHPIADCYAWVLMKNHFHFFLQIKDESEILQYQKNMQFVKLSGQMRAYQQFSNMFNAYSKAFNKKYTRTGSLFEHTYHRVEIIGIEEHRKKITYIHNNPVNHNFCNEAADYKWSSYLSYLEQFKNKSKKNHAYRFFRNRKMFHELHQTENVLTE
jgi:putative transposase